MLGVAASAIEDASESMVFEESRFNHTIEVTVAAIEPDPAQPRRQFDPAAIQSLATTMREQGQLQPVLLRRHPDGQGRWVIIAGERRWRAARLLGWHRILAMVHGGDADVAALIENLQRVDLSPVEEARGIGRLIAEKGWTQGRAAKVLGKPPSDISGTLRILDLPKDVLDEVLTSEHPPAKNVLIEMSRIRDLAVLHGLVGQARTGVLTVKAVRASRDHPAPEGAQAARPAPAPQPWLAVRRAREAIGRLAAAGMVMSAEETSVLQDLRAAVDRLLDHGRERGTADPEAG